jgi:predicted small secreted protein
MRLILVFLLLAAIMALLPSCVTTAAQVGTGVAAAGSAPNAAATHH